MANGERDRPAVAQGEFSEGVDSSPRATLQRLTNMRIQQSPAVVAQRKALAAILNSGARTAQRAMENIVQHDSAIQMIHVGREPDIPDNYRARTRIAGSTPAHYGGGDFNIQAGVLADNAGNITGAVAPAAVTYDYESDHVGRPLLSRISASQNSPEVDHIVPKANLGSNSYNNARVLSKSENAPGAAVLRPAAGNIVTTAHQNIRIRDNIGYDHTTAQGGQLNALDLARIATFGGLQTAINAPSGANINNVQIDEW